jgi:hypothetical protein
MFAYFLWLIEMGASILIYFWPVTLGLVIWNVISWSRAIDRRPAMNKRDFLWSICPLVGTLVILVLGCALAQAGMDASEWPVRALIVQLVGSVALLIRARGIRGAFAAVYTLELWLSCCMALVAGMSISDKWV